jgi:hypothetical protein
VLRTITFIVGVKALAVSLFGQGRGYRAVLGRPRIRLPHFEICAYSLRFSELSSQPSGVKN